jgi:hypothetical protein
MLYSSFFQRWLLCLYFINGSNASPSAKTNCKRGRKRTTVA